MVKREGINYPKFKDQFAVMDFDAEPLPVLSLYPMPPQKSLAEWKCAMTDTAGVTRTVTLEDLQALPHVRERTPLVCQIFNWSEKPEVTGVRLPLVLEAMGIDAPSRGYFVFYSEDGMYFETLRKIRREPAAEERILMLPAV